MAIPSRQIGWGPQENLLWGISKQLEKLGCQLCNVGIPGPQGPQGPPGPAGSLTDAYHAAFYSHVSQSDGVATEQLMRFEITDFAYGVSVVNNALGQPTKITYTYPGTYNLQFSAQLFNSGGGGSNAAVNIWLKKDGSAVPYSNTKVAVIANSPYVVASWNFFIEVTAPNQYVELAWNTNHAPIELHAQLPNGGVPGIPSIILTTNRIA